MKKKLNPIVCILRLNRLSRNTPNIVNFEFIYVLSFTLIGKKFHTIEYFRNFNFKIS